jgi:hypothetical protein
MKSREHEENGKWRLSEQERGERGERGRGGDPDEGV